MKNEKLVFLLRDKGTEGQGDKVFLSTQSRCHFIFFVLMFLISDKGTRGFRVQNVFWCHFIFFVLVMLSIQITYYLYVRFLIEFRMTGQYNLVFDIHLIESRFQLMILTIYTGTEYILLCFF